MHRDRDRERAASHEVIDDGGDGIDGDFAIETFARLRVDRVGHEVLGAETFLDVREVVILGLDQIAALATRCCRLAITMIRQQACGRACGTLTSALERIELIVTDTGGFVG